MIYHETEHGILYNWKLSEAVFSKDKGTVFSCFACGGGSTMGYKLAGFDVIGCNEIDIKLAKMYEKNHHPKYIFNTDIRNMLNADDLPQELYQLDILDGSPPCTSFSSSGKRESTWGKSKKFREGQTEQTLDDLFFVFIKLAKKLQPKVIISENVSAMLIGNAKRYANRVYDDMTDAGYLVSHYVLNAMHYGIAQSRERVFFIGIRNDIVEQIADSVENIFGSFQLSIQKHPRLIPFSEIRQDIGTSISNPLTEHYLDLWKRTLPGDNFGSAHEKGSCFNECKAHLNKPLPTIRASGLPFDYKEPRRIYLEELLLAFSFPMDYDFDGLNPGYVCGMSVPPLLIKAIAVAVSEQILEITARRIETELDQTVIDLT
jgi:DNA (cytosine-5)-methyltransferase 1